MLPSSAPSLAELRAGARVVALPLTTRFRGLTQREALLVEGPNGWTEFSPFLEYGDEESAAWLAAAIDDGWGAPPVQRRDRIVVNATLPAVHADRVESVLAAFPGCRTVKVKVAERGQSLADDLARVARARELLGPEGRVRVDANGGWNVDEAEHALRSLAVHDLEYAEQPCATVEELAELRARIRDLRVPIAADESVRKAADPLAVARAGAADLLVIKAQPLGGVTAALRIVEQAGLPVVVSSALDTSVGIGMGARLAAALEQLPFDCGLGTVALFARDAAAEPLVPRDGGIPVLRPAVTPESLAAVAAGPERLAWWLERLERCFELLA